MYVYRTATSHTPPPQLQMARELLASLGEQIEVADEGRSDDLDFILILMLTVIHTYIHTYIHGMFLYIIQLKRTNIICLHEFIYTRVHTYIHDAPRQ